MLKPFFLCLLAVQAASAQLTLTPFQADGTYDAGERVGWTVRLVPGAQDAGRYTYAIRQNNSDVVQMAELDLSLGVATIETTRYEPGMLYVELTQPNAAAIHVGAAVAPTRLRPSVARPADFDAFWAGKLQALSRVPMKPAVQKADSGRAGVELSTVQLQSVGSNVQAWLAKPERAGKLPALVIYQWAGVYAVNPNTALDRAAEGWLVLNVSSHDMPLTQATGAPPNYNAVGNSSREASYFLNMYLRDARAIDYITAHPEWDGKTLVLMGTSMGGQQSLVTAGLRNDKVTAVLVNEPSGADSNGDLNGSRAGYPNWNARDPKVMETALYFDVVNFAARIKAPVLAAVGYIDTTSPPAGIWRAMNQVPGRRDVIQMVESDHNNRTPEKQGEWNVRSKEWLDVLRTTTSAPQSR